MENQPVNLFLMAIHSNVNNVNAILEAWQTLIDEGIYEGFQNRNLMARVCESGSLQLLEFLMEHNFIFDRLAIYLSAIERADIVFLERLLSYQQFNDLNMNHLMTQLQERNLQQVIDFFNNLEQQNIQEAIPQEHVPEEPFPEDIAYEG